MDNDGRLGDSTVATLRNDVTDTNAEQDDIDQPPVVSSGASSTCGRGSPGLGSSRMFFFPSVSAARRLSFNSDAQAQNHIGPTRKNVVRSLDDGEAGTTSRRVLGTLWPGRCGDSPAFDSMGIWARCDERDDHLTA